MKASKTQKWGRMVANSTDECFLTKAVIDLCIYSELSMAKCTHLFSSASSQKAIMADNCLYETERINECLAMYKNSLK